VCLWGRIHTVWAVCQPLANCGQSGSFGTCVLCVSHSAVCQLFCVFWVFFWSCCLSCGEWEPGWIQGSSWEVLGWDFQRVSQALSSLPHYSFPQHSARRLLVLLLGELCTSAVQGSSCTCCSLSAVSCGTTSTSFSFIRDSMRGRRVFPFVGIMCLIMRDRTALLALACCSPHGIGSAGHAFLLWIYPQLSGYDVERIEHVTRPLSHTVDMYNHL
jgi:hypothetical protein